MEYRTIERLQVRPSLLGYGCMRFPTLPSGEIDEPAAKALLDRAIRGGVTYFDTAYFYHNGASEAFTARALAEYPRESYYLTSKLPVVLVHSLEEAKQLYAEQRKRLKRDYLDFYLLHALNAARFRDMVEMGVVDWCLELQEKGEFRHFGFSFHGDYKEFEEILTARPWDVCQLQFNYMDTENQGGIAAYELAERLGVPVIVMEPVKGGALASPPAEVLELLQGADPAASPSSWALRWAASRPNIMTVLSGMSTMEQVEDNLATFSPLKPLNGEEEQLLVQAAARFRSRMKNGCTGCKYCMPCPAGVDIPENFKIWNNFAMYGEVQRTARYWRELEEKGTLCVDCGACEEKCPQRLQIRSDLKRAAEELAALS